MRCTLLLSLLLLSLFAQGQTAMAQTPDGTGDPALLTCRPPQLLPGSRLPGPKVCKTNAEWARYHRDGMDVAADGVHDVQSEKWRSIHPQSCHPATMGGSGTSTMMQMNVGTICD